MSYSDEVKAAVQGRWLEVLIALTGSDEINRAAQRLGRHGPCPVHGGRDGFRFFRDANATGGCICNTCGPHPDGWSTLMWINNWDFKRALSEVGDYLGIEKKRSSSQPRGGQIRGGAAVASTVATKAPVQTQTTRGRSVPVRQAQKAAALSKAVHTHASVQGRKPASAGLSEVLNPKAEALWREALPIRSQSGIEAYLQSRGIRLSHRRWTALVEADALRFHPGCPYRDDEIGQVVGKLPAILAAVRNEHGQLVTVHRLYLNASMKKAKRIKYQGKFLAVTAKKMMSTASVWDITGRSIAGSAIKLTEPRKGILSLAEGVETALSAFRVTGIPVWAAVNASMLEKVQIPDDVKLLIIWADRDRSGTGEKSALKLKSRLQTQRPDVAVHILLPPLGIPKGAKGVDWNDVLVTQGVMGFPIERLRKVMDALEKEEVPSRRRGIK